MAKKETTKREKKPTESKGIKYLGGLLLRKMALGGARELATNSEEVNKLNVFPVPDGDTGDNMRMTIESGISAIEGMDSDDLAGVMKTLSHGMLLGARGNSGVILSQFFAGTAKGLTSFKKADPVTLGHAFEMGVKQAYSSVMTPTEGTVLTVAREAVEYAVKRLDENSTIRTFFADLVKEMHDSLERTPEFLKVLKEAGVVDSGGAGLFYIMDGFNRALNGEEIAAPADAVVSAKPAAKPVTFAFNADSEMTYGYCTELLVQLQNSKCKPETFDIDALRAFLSEIGDSIVAFQTESIVKLHVHTFTPEKVLAHCRKYGEFLAVKIENMSVQHTELESEAEPAAAAPAPHKTYGIVVVSTGAGIEKLFRELGADVVIQGGQTQNPSTNDFLDAFAKINADHIFVFPNNGNIVMAAQQAGELYQNAKIHVLPSKSIGTGYVALTCFEPENLDATAVEAAMQEAMDRVTAGFISPAIRDTEMNGIQIHDGDTIGIIGKEVVVSNKNRTLATQQMASHLLSLPDVCMLTIFCGTDATEAEREALTKYLAEKHPDAEVYFMEGGQEVYPYIFVVE